jgi:hypothetical protein
VGRFRQHRAVQRELRAAVAWYEEQAGLGADLLDKFEQAVGEIVRVPQYLMTFRADYNRRFGKPPKSEHDAHRPLRPSDDLDEIFTWQEERKITGDLVVHYKRGMYLLDQTPEALKLRRKLVQVYEREDGTVTLKHKGVTLPFGKFDKDQRVRQGEIVDNKHLGAALAFAQRLQKERDEKALGSRAVTSRRKKRIRADQAECEATADHWARPIVA